MKYAERKREVLQPMCGIIEEDYFKRQHQRWCEEMTSEIRIDDNVPKGACRFNDKYLNGQKI
jgi:hypothetical protein